MPLLGYRDGEVDPVQKVGRRDALLGCRDGEVGDERVGGSGLNPRRFRHCSLHSRLHSRPHSHPPSPLF